MPESSDGNQTPDNVNSGGGGKDYRRRNRNRGNRKSDGEDKFQGWTPELKGHYYHTIMTDPRESFQKTTKTIAAYVARKYEGGEEFRQAMLNMRLDDLVEPVINDSDVDNKIIYKKWERELKKYNEALKQRKINNDLIYNVVLGQCTPAMKERLEAEHTFEQVDHTTDIIGLLRLIQNQAGNKNGNEEPSQVLMKAFKNFFDYEQGNMSLSDYHAGFKDRVDILERLQGPIEKI